jgi:hypothetical protein
MHRCSEAEAAKIVHAGKFVKCSSIPIESACRWKVESIRLELTLKVESSKLLFLMTLDSAV